MVPVRKYSAICSCDACVGLREQPQHHEERHHGGHEVGVGHLPGAAVMGRVALALLLDDDDVGAARSSAIQPSALQLPHGCSSSWLVGRSSEKMPAARNSIARSRARAAGRGQHAFLDAQHEARLRRVACISMLVAIGPTTP